MNKQFERNLKIKRARRYRIVFFLLFFLIISMVLFLLAYFLIPAKDITNLGDNIGATAPSQENSVNDGKSEPSSTQTVQSEAPVDKYDEYSYTFSADLSSYEQYMNPHNDDYLFLVNVDNKLQENYIPDDLTDVIYTRDDGRNTQQMRLYAEKALEALFIEAQAQGMTYVNPKSGYGLSVMSAYRSYAYQKQLFDQRVASTGSEEAASKIVQYPGASEHQSGLCCDMHNLSSADESYESDASAKWLAENSYKFGFILRYPKDKTEITGISFEPWHFRFVGRYHASKMYELGMCLEEYMEYIKK